MNPDLAKLIDLQATENEIKRIDAALLELPRRREALAARLAQEGAQLTAARDGLANTQKRRRQSEVALQDLEGRRSKYKGQLMEVKTNKEYQAMLHEIEAVEREIRAVEDRILEDMEAGENLSAAMTREQGVFAEAETDHKRAVAELEVEARKLEADRQRWQGERDSLAQGLPAELIERHERVARRRGVAVCEVRDGTCQECRMVLRPQMYVELKRNDQITECPSCSRILYYMPPLTVPADAQL